MSETAENQGSTTPFASGHCLCGAVHFSVAVPPLMSGQCHCEHCQRASGNGHMSIVFFKEETVTIAGTSSSYTSITDTGSHYTRHFCTTCGSRLFGYNSARPGVVSIAIGVFNDHSWFKPDRIVYHRSKPAWDFMNPELPTFEMMPPPPPANV